MNHNPSPGTSGYQTDQIFCPNCRGGNPPNATVCMWCKRPLTYSIGQQQAETRSLQQAPNYPTPRQPPQQPPQQPGPYYPPPPPGYYQQPPPVVVVQKSGGGCFKWIGIAVVALIVIVAVAAVASPKGGTNTARNTNTNTNSSVPAAPAALAPPYKDIVAKKDTLTDAQWDAYAETLKGLRIENWQGTILNVDNKLFSNDVFQVDIDLDGEGGSLNVAEANIDVSQADALKMSKGQEITLSGNIKQIDCVLTYCPVEVENAIFTLK